MTNTLKMMMAASLLLTGAQALAAEGDESQQRAGQAVAEGRNDPSRIEVCFDHPETFRSRFHKEGPSFDSRPGKYDSAFN